MDWRLISLAGASFAVAVATVAAMVATTGGPTPSRRNVVALAPLFEKVPAVSARPPAEPAREGPTTFPDDTPATASIKPREPPGPAIVASLVQPPTSDDPEPLVLQNKGGTASRTAPRQPAGVPVQPRPRTGEATAERPRATISIPSAPPMNAERPTGGVLTLGGIRIIRTALRLRPDQEAYWPPVESILAEIAGQQAALVQAGRNPNEVFGLGLKMRAYSAARPLLGVLSEQQKAELRRRARSMGFEAVAAAI